jgi:hypothetical protein
MRETHRALFNRTPLVDGLLTVGTRPTPTSQPAARRRLAASPPDLSDLPDPPESTIGRVPSLTTAADDGIVVPE